MAATAVMMWRRRRLQWTAAVALLMAEALLIAAVASGRVMPAVKMINRDDSFEEFIFVFKKFWMA